MTTTTEKTATTHVNDEIDKTKALFGYGHGGGQATPEVQQKVLDIIIDECRKQGFNNRDVAYCIAIVKRESGLNPDAANPTSTASGPMQILDDTAKHLKLEVKDKFDARKSIRAGASYFSEIKNHVVQSYGSAAGKYEPLIYYCFHYGRYIINRREIIKGEVVVKEPLPFSQLEKNPRYLDSRTVVDETIRIEKILNDTHGLRITLNDVLGKAMAGRKVIVVTKTPVPITPASMSASTVTPELPVTSQSSPQQQVSDDNSSVSAPTGNDSLNADLDKSDASPHVGSSLPIVKAEDIDQVHVTWELNAIELTTDADGNLPEISSDTSIPITVLIPRIEYDSYIDAVVKNDIPENGNEHEINCRAEPEVQPAVINTSSVAKKSTTMGDTPAKKKNTPKIPTPGNATTIETKAKSASVFEAAEQGVKQQPSKPPSPGTAITFGDIVTAMQKDLGWQHVIDSSFSYIKNFFTKPKLPDKPLDEYTPTVRSKARQQVISSSLKNQETKTQKIKDKVTTTLDTATKPVDVNTDAPWMVFALQEQAKSNTAVKESPNHKMEVEGSQKDDVDWKEEKVKRNGAEASLKKAQSELKHEQQRPEKKRDTAKMIELKEHIKEQEAIRNNADNAMMEIEKKYNDPDIIKYLQSTSTDKDAARDDSTAWCASFANWCVGQAGYKGNGASAGAWLSWGEELKEPRYGAITVVTRHSNPTLYHVGFFLHLGKRNLVDGEEEIEIIDKNGKKVKKKKKKFREAKTVRLLSGNYSDQIKEDDAWYVSPSDNPSLHLVSYRWPTLKEKK